MIKNTNSNKDTDELINAWKSAPYYSTKESQYFPIYANLFSHLRNTNCTFVEIGILGGGSLFMWRNWLGPNARIIGIDLNLEATKWQKFGFEIYIGDQGSKNFLYSTLKKIGGFDALLDDGGHQSFQQIATVQAAIEASNRSSIIAVEDTACSFMLDFGRHRKNSFLQYCKDSTDLLVGKTFNLYPNRFRFHPKSETLSLVDKVSSIEFFPGIVSMKISDSQPEPKVLYNMSTMPISDYRYAGNNKFKTTWPTLKGNKKVTIRGGSSLVGNVRRKLKQLI